MKNIMFSLILGALFALISFESRGIDPPDFNEEISIEQSIEQSFTQEVKIFTLSVERDIAISSTDSESHLDFVKNHFDPILTEEIISDEDVGQNNLLEYYYNNRPVYNKENNNQRLFFGLGSSGGLAYSCGLKTL